jgi:hypothetical protein
VQQRLKVEQQSAEIEQRAPRFHLDEEIDIAFLVVVASRDGTENAHIPGAAMLGHPQDFFPPPVAKFLKSHGVSESNRIKDEARWAAHAGIRIGILRRTSARTPTWQPGYPLGLVAPRMQPMIGRE